MSREGSRVAIGKEHYMIVVDKAEVDESVFWLVGPKRKVTSDFHDTSEIIATH